MGQPLLMAGALFIFLTTWLGLVVFIRWAERRKRSMQQWTASVPFLTIWLGLVGTITWFDRLNIFLYYPYWFSVGVLLAIAAAPLLVCWKSGHRHILGISLLLGVVWLVVLFFVPLSTDRALLMRRNQIQIGMTKAQVQAVMAGYSGGESGFAHADNVEGLGFCTDDPDCETSVRVDFVSGRVVRVSYDID